MHLRNAIGAAVVASTILAACGSGTSASSTATTASSSSSTTSASSNPPNIPNNPFAGKTIRLISSGAAGSTHDLALRAAAPYLAKYLHATADVVDMPGGGQLLAWNYVSKAAPDGLTIGTTDIQGLLANRWEKVPNETPNIQDLSYLGFVGGGVAGGAKVLFSVNTSNPPLTSIYTLVQDHTTKVTYLGSVGDVSVPMLFKIYNIPYTALTTYSGSLAELQGILRGDGQLSSKTWGGSWASFVTSGKGKVLLEFSMRKTWGIDANVPTLYSLLQKDPPATASEKAALEANASALDAGMGLFGPAGIPANKLAILQAAIKWTVAQPGFIAQSKKSALSTAYESPQQEIAVIKAGINPTTEATIRKFVPLSTGVAS
ncbi:MAG: hypothetical protein EPN30_06905 [Actinomycetota bacterium]|nr:MAG: hypothetical protein EPN30_06905 [Actinomycetota bacterium]